MEATETFNPSFKKTSKRYLRDAKNLFLHGSRAPLTHQLLWLNPCEIRLAIHTPFGEPWIFKRKHSARVVPGNWDNDVIDIDHHPKMKACSLHFQQGLSWEKAGMFELMLKLIEKSGSFDGYKNIDDLEKRYSSIDRLYEKVKADGVLLPRKHFIPNNHREFGGILIHIGRNGEPIFHGSGCHRLSIARALNLTRIPCELGIIHKRALTTKNFLNIARS